MKATDTATCHRCGKRHVSGWVWLELNRDTNTWHEPGDVPTSQSQGLFRFGLVCARRALARKLAQPTETDPTWMIVDAYNHPERYEK